VVCPRCAPGIGGQRKFGGQAKKISGVCAPNFKTVSAPMLFYAVFIFCFYLPVSRITQKKLSNNFDEIFGRVKLAITG